LRSVRGRIREGGGRRKTARGSHATGVEGFATKRREEISSCPEVKASNMEPTNLEDFEAAVAPEFRGFAFPVGYRHETECAAFGHDVG
jgi:hypothetical protein